jgi:mRNA interferase MazF
VVILQDDRFDATLSITVCGLTSNPTEAPLFRVPIAPSLQNGLKTESHLMVDKITTIRRDRFRQRVGKLDDTDVVRFNRAIMIFLGLAAGRDASRRLPP